MGIILIRTVILYLCIIAALRLMGKRQMGELQPSELVVTLIIAEVAAIPMQSNDIPLIYGVISIAALVSMEVLLSSLSLKLPWLGTLLSGRPSVVVEDGRIDQREMARQRFTVSDLCEELRLQKVNRLADVSYAVLETNGQLSVFLKPQATPATRRDVGAKAEDLGVVRLLVSDGCVSARVCRQLGLTEADVRQMVEAKGMTVQDTFYCTVDGNGNILEIIGKEHPR
ncbi:MAG: DUF421 domain-containing protein [Clostridia bacterium]|nr:DUF421 domain-containing protein [Clostridia bacterium]